MRSDRDSEQMPSHTDVCVVRLDAEINHVGQGIFLCVDRPVRHRLRQVRDIDEHGLEAEPPERILVTRIVQRAQSQPDAVRRGPYRPHAVADVPDPIVPPAQHAVAGCCRDLFGECGALIAIQPGKDHVSCTRLEWFVEYPQRRNACRQIAGREIASVELAALHHGQQVRRLTALRDDAVRHPDAECSVGAAGDTLAEGMEAPRVD